jgi:hypothetical protein
VGELDGVPRSRYPELTETPGCRSGIVSSMKTALGFVLTVSTIASGSVRAQSDPVHSFFSGKDLSGWHVEPAKAAAHWSVADGMIIGDNPDKSGSLLWTDADHGDYELVCEFRTDSPDYDSGVFVRGTSHQVQIGISRSLKRDLTACIYAPKDKKGGYPATSDRVVAVHKPGAWNRLRIRVVGRRIQTFLNDERMVDYLGVTLQNRGRIGLQLHAKVHQKMLFRSLKLTPIASGGAARPNVWEDHFETQGALSNWHPTQKDRWKISDTRSARGKALHLLGVSRKYKPPFRSPHSILLLKNKVLSDFVLTARVKTLQKPTGHRDMCVFFGWQDPANFYYVHLGEKPDPHSSQIFIVKQAPRTSITTKNAGGVPWKDDHWHEVKVVRRVEDGAIEIYFDDMKTPVKVARDTTFQWGLIGLGSFDDLGMWDDVRIDGVLVGGKKPVLPGDKPRKGQQKIQQKEQKRAKK